MSGAQPDEVVERSTGVEKQQARSDDKNWLRTCLNEKKCREELAEKTRDKLDYERKIEEAREGQAGQGCSVA